MAISQADRDRGFLRAIFRAELEEACIYGAIARRNLEDAIQLRYSDGVWMAVQSALTNAANASKLLWGSQKNETVPDVRRYLRDLAGVDDSSPLKPREIRNAFEHIDEEISRWVKRADRRTYGTRQVGWRDTRPTDDVNFGYFDPETWEVSFLSERPVSVKAVLQELVDIGSRLRPGRSPLG